MGELPAWHRRWCLQRGVRPAAGEMKALLVGLTMNASGHPYSVADLEADVRYVMSQFDSNSDGSISRSEFHSALLRCGRRR